MVGPKIQKPGTDLPIKYEQNGSSKDNALSLDSWWKNFNDEDLNNYINIAIKNNYDLKIAIEKIEQARSIYRIKKADLFPEINLTAQTIRQQISKNLTTSFFQESINQNYFQFGFDAIWELDFFGKLARSKQAAYFSYLQTQDSLLNVYIILLSDVAKTYIDIITLKNKIRINERKLFLQNQIYELNLKKFESGLSSEILEKEQYKIIQSISQDIVNLKTFYKTNINRLAVLLGRIPEDLDKDFNKEKPIPQVAKDIDVGLPSELLRRRPDIRRAENLLYEKTANIGVAVAQLFPSFSLIGGFNYESSKTKNWFTWASKSWFIGPTFDLPLLDFGRRIANVDATKADEKQALYSYKNTVLLALEDVENALVSYFHEKQNLSLILNKYNAQKKITKLKKDLFTSGLESKINYLEYELVLLDDEDEYIDKERNVSIDLISLIKALGGGW